jgi:hypothetical protein
MLDDWNSVLSAKGAAWGVPAEQITSLNTERFAARTLWDEEQDPATHTKVIAEQARIAFRLLEVHARYIKKHWFLVPPLTTADLVSLGLPVPDTDKTSIPAPVAQVEADLTFPGVHMVMLSHFRPVGGTHSPNPKSDYGVAMHYGLSGTPTESHPIRIPAPPTAGNQLPEYHFITAGKLILDLEGESGNTLYFSLCYENARGMSGPFGPIVKAVIP